MDALHLHLALNHIPIFSSMLGILFWGYGVLSKNHHVYRVGLFLFILTGLSAVAVFLTGDGAEEVVERVQGMSHRLIHHHEDFASYALWSSIALGVVSLAGFFIRVLAMTRIVRILVPILALVTAGLMGWTAYLGGQIRHTEIRPASVQESVQQSPQQPMQQEDDDDE